MAYPLLHLLVAEAYAKGRPQLATSGAYYLGAIAPDAVHAWDAAPVGARKMQTHLHTRGIDPHESAALIAAYLREQGDAPFHIGFAVHVLADRIWVAFYREAYPALFDADGKIIAPLYRADAAWLERALYARLNRPAFLDLLRHSRAPQTPPPPLSQPEIDTWRTMVLATLDGYDSTVSGAPSVMTLDGVLAFIEASPAQLTALLPE